MDYKRIYNKLIDRAKHRQLDGYRERHHIVPSCMGGSDCASNLVYLTPEEHYVAHQLLVKIHPTHDGLIHAAMKMTRGRKGNKVYGWLRKRFIDVCRKRTGKNNPNYGKIWINRNGTTENKTINADEPIPEGWSRGRVLSLGKECVVCNALHKKQGKYCSKECLQKIGAGYYKKGNFHTEETKQKIAKKAKGHKRNSGKNNPMYNIKYKWMNNGKQNKKVLLEEIDNYVQQGWTFGLIAG